MKRETQPEETAPLFSTPDTLTETERRYRFLKLWELSFAGSWNVLCGRKYGYEDLIGSLRK